MNTIATLPKTKPVTERTHCCSDTACSSGLRNNYFLGKRLTADSFRVEQDYLVGRRRLLNRALYGWGVVYGYQVHEVPASAQTRGAPSGRLTIGPGFALDEPGRELLQIDPTEIGFGDVILFDDQGKRVRRSHECDKEQSDERYEETCWLLSVHYAEQPVDRVDLRDPCACERREWNHVCETVRYSLRPIDCDECCAKESCELDCGCGQGDCCKKHLTPRPPANKRPSPDTRTHNPVSRGGCDCLCDHLMHPLPDGECGPLCEIDEACGRIRVDLHCGVPLACVHLVRDECRRLVFDGEIEACGPRRLVKRNDVLFDLIQGCDLTRISWMSWADWYRKEVDFGTFAGYFAKYELEKEFTTRELIRGTRPTNFRLGFSKPVISETVKADCFAMRIMFLETEGGWRETSRVPIVDVLVNDDEGFATEAILVVRAGWADDAIFGTETRFESVYGARVEIEIRGDYILDCNGQAIDANAVGLSAAPTGNGTPGGTHLTTFKVRRREVPTDAEAY